MKGGGGAMIRDVRFATIVVEDVDDEEVLVIVLQMWILVCYESNLVESLFNEKKWFSSTYTIASVS